VDIQRRDSGGDTVHDHRVTIQQDPYGEFFIEEHEDMRKENLNEDYNDTYLFEMSMFNIDDSYWEQRYTLKPKQVPVFLARCIFTFEVTPKLSLISCRDDSDYWKISQCNQRVWN
jgi:hypothetical protein